MTTGTRIRARRQQLKLTQDELSELTSISQTQISEYERDRSSLRADGAVAIARVLETTVEWLVTGEGDAPEGLVASAAESGADAA